MHNLSIFSCFPSRLKRQGQQQSEDNRYQRLLDRTLLQGTRNSSDQFHSSPTVNFSPTWPVTSDEDVADRTEINPNRNLWGRIGNRIRRFPIINRISRFNSKQDPHHIPDAPANYPYHPRHENLRSSSFNSYLAASNLTLPNESIHPRIPSQSGSLHHEPVLSPPSLFLGDTSSFQSEHHILNPFHSPSLQATYPVGIGDSADFFEPGLFVTENRFTWPIKELRKKPAVTNFALPPIAKNPQAVRVSLLENSPVFQVILDDFLTNPKASTQPVEMMLAHGANPNQVTKRNTPVLTEAIRANHPRAFKLFLNLPGTNINKQDLLGFTPLATAVICNNDFAFKKLLARGADIMCKDSTGRTALDWAALMGKPDMLKDLLKASQAKKRLGHNATEESITPQKKRQLIHMVRQQQDRIETLKALTASEKRRFAIVLVDRRQIPELMALLSSGLDQEFVKSGKLVANTDNDLYLDVATTLIAAGSTPDIIRGADNESLLSSAIFWKQSKTGHMLLNAGADPSLKDNRGQNSLHYAAVEGLHGLVEPLLRSGVRIDETDLDGDTALTLSDGPNHEATMLELIKAGANVHHKGSKSTPLTNALNWDHIDAVKALLERGATPKDTDALMKTTDPKIIQQLISAGADVNKPNEYGETPLMRHTDPQIIQQLFAAGADVNKQNMDGETALMWHTDPEVIQQLLAAGADVNIQDQIGKTALITAVEQYAPGAVKVLLEAGAKVKIGQHSAWDVLREPTNPDAEEQADWADILSPEEIAESHQFWNELYNNQKNAYDRIHSLLTHN